MHASCCGCGCLLIVVALLLLPQGVSDNLFTVETLAPQLNAPGVQCDVYSEPGLRCCILGKHPGAGN